MNALKMSGNRKRQITMYDVELLSTKSVTMDCTNWWWSCRNHRCTSRQAASVGPHLPPVSAAQTGFSKHHTEIFLWPAQSSNTTPQVKLQRHPLTQ